MCETTFGFFGFFGTSGFTFTGAVSVAVTSGPDRRRPDRRRNVVKTAQLLGAAALQRMFGRVHEYVTAAPGAIEANAGISAFVRLQFGDNGSTTCTSVKVTFPVFVTVIENVAVPPTATVCDFGFFTIAIAGAGTGVTVNGSHAPVCAG